MEEAFYFVLKIFLLFLLSLLAIIDLKTKETPYFLSFSLILSGLLSIIIYLIGDFDINSFKIIVFNMIFSFVLSYLKYKFGLWGGGDYLVFIGISFYITILFPFLFSTVLFLIFVYISTVFYNTFYILLIYLKNKLFSKYELFFLFLLIIAILSKNLLFFSLTISLWLLIIIHKINTLYFTKKISINELKEEDWLAYDIYKNNKIILKVNEVREGLSKKDINYLKEKKVDFVYIKEGIPYLPTFLFAFILMLIKNRILDLFFFYF